VSRPAPIVPSARPLPPELITAGEEPLSWPDPTTDAAPLPPPETPWPEERPALEVPDAGRRSSRPADAWSNEPPAAEPSAIAAEREDDAAFSWPDNPVTPPAPISWSDEIVARPSPRPAPGPISQSPVSPSQPKLEQRERASLDDLLDNQADVGPLKIPSTLKGSPPPATKRSSAGSLSGVSPYAPTVPQEAYKPAPYDPYVGATPKPPEASKAPPSSAKLWLALAIALVVIAAIVIVFLVVH
jgi:hypothetical protein